MPSTVWDKIDSLERLARDRAATPGEKAAAKAAIERLKKKAGRMPPPTPGQVANNDWDYVDQFVRDWFRRREESQARWQRVQTATRADASGRRKLNANERIHLSRLRLLISMTDWETTFVNGLWSRRDKVMSRKQLDKLWDIIRKYMGPSTCE